MYASSLKFKHLLGHVNALVEIVMEVEGVM